MIKIQINLAKKDNHKTQMMARLMTKMIHRNSQHLRSIHRIMQSETCSSGKDGEPK